MNLPLAVTRFLKALLIVVAILSPGPKSHLLAAVWQWSVPVESVTSTENNDHPRAFLWIPPNCQRVRAVVVGQHNMIEEGILEHPAFRKALSETGMAPVERTFSITRSP